MADATGKLARCRRHMAEINFDVVPRADVKNQAPDALSRLETDGDRNRPLDDDLRLMFISWGTSDDSEDEGYSTYDKDGPPGPVQQTGTTDAVVTILTVHDSPPTLPSPTELLQGQKEYT